jgi:hypothetical protein
MTAVVRLFTPLVVTVNVADVLPEGTVTEAGTFAAILLEFKVMTAPLGPAGPERVTVPVDDEPP